MQSLKVYGLMMIVSLAAVGCQSKVSTTKAGGSVPAQAVDQPVFSITGRKPVVVSPGATVTLVGTGFAAGMKLISAALVGEAVAAPIDIKVISDVQATFVAPAVGAFGPMALTVQQGDETQSISVFFDAGKTDHPIMTVDTKQVCAGIKYYRADGVLTEGVKDCSKSEVIDDCAVEGEVGCVTTKAAKATIVANLAEKVVAGQFVAGVAGSAAVRPADCAADGDDSCVVSAPRKALNPASIDAAKMLTTQTLLGVQGTIAPPDPWDVRVGENVAGVTGMLKTSCRNKIDRAKFTIPYASLDNAGTVSGTGLDWWDTIDDYNNLSLYISDFANNPDIAPPDYVSAWDNFICGGVDDGTAPTAGNVWVDVSTSGTCANGACRFKDKISGLEWSATQSGSNWTAAVQLCEGLNTSPGYDGVFTNWRLPTQKELMEVYTHGITSVARANWITPSDMYVNYFWSSSTSSSSTSDAWYVLLGSGEPNYTAKAITHRVACVR